MSFIQQLLGRGKPLLNSFTQQCMFNKKPEVTVGIGSRVTDVSSATRVLINPVIGLGLDEVAYSYHLDDIKVNKQDPEKVLKVLEEFGVVVESLVKKESFFSYSLEHKQQLYRSAWYAVNKSKTFVVLLQQGEMFIVSNKDMEETVTMMHAKLYSHFPAFDTSHKKRYVINMITGTDDDLTVSEFSVPQRDYEVSPSHYLPTFPKFHSDLLNWIKSSEVGQPGLAILYGPPGTGKSTLVKSLMAYAGENNKEVFYITPAFAESLASPNVLPLLAQYSNSVIIIEDAEAILKQRQAGEVNAVSTILNLTDGVLGDLMNLKIVCTFNTDLDQVDPALLRPGRLFGKHYFGNLPPEQASLIKPGLVTTRDMSLAEIFAS